MKPALLVAVIMGMLVMMLFAPPAQVQGAQSGGLVGGHPEGKFPIAATVTVVTSPIVKTLVGVIDTDAGEYFFNIGLAPAENPEVLISVTFPAEIVRVCGGVHSPPCGCDTEGNVFGIDQLTGACCDNIDIHRPAAGILLCQNPQRTEVSRINVDFMLGGSGGQ